MTAPQFEPHSVPIRFPTLDALSLAITSEVISAEVAAAPVEACFGENGAILAAPRTPLSQSTVDKLRALGAGLVPDEGLPLEAFPHWLALLPLVRTSGPPKIGDKTPVLFDIGGGGHLATIVAEMLRLGNDRQSFRQLAGPPGERTLLRVLGPPYYTLLRALDAPVGPIAAYYEQAPRVWVQLGYEHPLAGRVRPPAGKLLLIRSPRQWEMLDEGPFRDVYQALEFQLPADPASWQPTEFNDQFQVPLRLTTAAATDPAELWVIADDAASQIEQLVSSSDNELVARLAFAVVERDGQTIVVLKVRPSKLSPPVLILRGIGCRGYLNLANLFVPVGQRLHPPLRRDAVAKLLAADPHQIVWLHPSYNGTFTPCSVPDAAFRPLAEWVDYILDREHEPLGAWIESHRFDFASFICTDDAPARDRPPPKERPERTAPASSTPTPAETKTSASAPVAEEPVVAELVEEEEAPAELARALPQPSEIQQQLTRLERQFAELASPLDAPDRQTLWREMAWLNGALDRKQDASLCWSHALWENGEPSRGDVQQWLAAVNGPGRAEFPSASDLSAALADGGTQRLAALKLAVHLLAAAQRNEAVPAEQLSLASRVLAQHETAMPLRVAWLGWLALARLSHGDALALARARDRLLMRLLETGLTAEHDLPGFLRTGSGATSDRQRILREKLLDLRDHVAEWIAEPPSPLARTRAYADLVFAYGLARLGETEQSQRIAASARQRIGSRDSLHSWALAAYEHRIADAAKGADRTQLHPELITIMELMERVDRYKADRLRQHSRIIEPLERIDPYRRWHRHYTDELARELACLFDLTDRSELAARLEKMLDHPPAAAQLPRGRVRLVTTALELSPRLGERFAQRVIGLVVPAWQESDDTVDRAWLLEKGLLVAAHFDEREAVQALVERFEGSLESIIETYLSLQTEHHPERQEKLITIETLFQQSLKGLRKLGLRDEISRIFQQIVGLVHADASRPARKGAKGKAAGGDATRAAKLLLTVAGGWFYFGDSEQARPLVEEIRQQLLDSEKTIAPVPKAQLACAYVAAIGQAPLELALPLVEELFGKDGKGERNLRGVSDPMSTSSHFSLTQLDLVEAAVLTLVSDEFVLSPETHRWLEEDEFLVRRRIHRDVRQMMGQGP